MLDINDVIDNMLSTYIAKSNIHGHGLFAIKDMNEEITLGILDGQIITWDLHDKYDLTLEWNAISKETLLVRPYRTKYSFINHSRTPNLQLKYNPLRVVTLKKIHKDEELTLDYRKEHLTDEYISQKGSYL